MSAVHSPNSMKIRVHSQASSPPGSSAAAGFSRGSKTRFLDKDLVLSQAGQAIK